MFKRLRLMLLFCLIVLIPLAACQQEDSHKLIECPLEGLEWGMTWDQVVGQLKLTDKELEESNIDPKTVTYLPLAADRAGLPENFCNFPITDDLNETGWNVVYLQFLQDKNMERYLYGVILSIGGDYDTVVEHVNQTYGKSFIQDEKPYWVSTNPNGKIASRTFESYSEEIQSMLTGTDGKIDLEWRTLPYINFYLPQLGSEENNRYALNFTAELYVRIKLAQT